MGSYHEGGGEAIDLTSGALVWVRRRNGSWWPGRILGFDELKHECSIPQRSGTPIKLLGKEDGSMDWYNLDKTTRVKAFRCGEYDKDIEKAKTSVTQSNRKGSNGAKYVRREDAILHALELEKLGNSNECQKICTELNNRISKTNNGPAPLRTFYDESFAGRNFDILDESSPRELSQSVVSFEDPNNLINQDLQFVQRKRLSSPNDSDEDFIDGARRTEELNNLRDRSLLPRSKQFQSAHTFESFKKRCRRLSLSKLLEGPTTTAVSSHHQNILRDGDENLKNESLMLVGNGSTNSSTSCEETSTDTSLETFSDSIYSENSSSETEYDDSRMMGFVTNYCSVGFRHTPCSVRGKCENKGSFSQNSNLDVARRRVIPRDRAGRFSRVYEGIEENVPSGSSTRISTRFHNRVSNPSFPKVKRRPRYLKLSKSELEGFHPVTGYRNEGNFQFGNFTGESSCRPSAFDEYRFSDLRDESPLVSSFYDVEVDVLRSYHGPRAPLVSLRSRADDIAVVGHRVTVETMEDGACDHLLRKKFAGIRASGFGPKKIRKLSSITVDRRNARTPESEKMIGGTFVTCIPMRLVFSRITNALSSPPSLQVG